MTYPAYDTDLAAIYRAEVMGEALFSTTAALTFSANRGKWRSLAALERQTKSRYLDFVGGADQAARFPLGSMLLGYVFGVLFALLPWRRAMGMLLSGTPPLIEVFARLQQHAADDNRAFFDYVLRHEQAIEQFARAELAGEAGAIACVEALLDQAGG